MDKHIECHNSSIRHDLGHFDLTSFLYICFMAKSNEEIAGNRVDYGRHVLIESEVGNDPFSFMNAWLEEAQKQHPTHFNAFTLCTASKSGFPHSRVVLLKGVEQHGLVFFTNYNSRKGQDIAANGKVSANFFWPSLERQVGVVGIARKISAEESDAYFASRPRGSQIGAWASAQSETIANREILEQRVKDLEAQHEGKEIQRPEHWGGYIIIPHYFEFWQGRASRLHDRMVFQMDADGEWFTHRLSP